LEKKWMTRSASQLTNRWYHELRRRLHETDIDVEMLTKVLAHGRKALPILVLRKTQIEVNRKLNRKGLVTRKSGKDPHQTSLHFQAGAVAL
jgi:hypothetical protein